MKRIVVFTFFQACTIAGFFSSFLASCKNVKHEKKLFSYKKEANNVLPDSLQGFIASGSTFFKGYYPFVFIKSKEKYIVENDFVFDSLGMHLKPKWNTQSLDVELPPSNHRCRKGYVKDSVNWSQITDTQKVFVNGKPLKLITQINGEEIEILSTRLIDEDENEKVVVSKAKNIYVNWFYAEYRSNGEGKLIELPLKKINPNAVKSFFTLCSQPIKQSKAILVDKQSFELYYYENGKLVKRIKAGWGQNPDGHKQEQGDNRTPEGEYYITKKVKGPFSGGGSEYLGSAYMELNYPNIIDAKKGLDAKKITPAQYYSLVEANKNKTVIPKTTKLGGAVGLHGWISDYNETGDLLMTYGCICMLNKNIEWLYNVCPKGTMVYVF